MHLENASPLEAQGKDALEWPECMSSRGQSFCSPGLFQDLSGLGNTSLAYLPRDTGFLAPDC